MRSRPACSPAPASGRARARCARRGVGRGRPRARRGPRGTSRPSSVRKTDDPTREAMPASRPAKGPRSPAAASDAPQSAAPRATDRPRRCRLSPAAGRRYLPPRRVVFMVTSNLTEDSQPRAHPPRSAIARAPARRRLGRCRCLASHRSHGDPPHAMGRKGTRATTTPAGVSPSIFLPPSPRPSRLRGRRRCPRPLSRT